MEEKKIYYKVIEIMPVESGTSQTTGREWKSREFVAEEIAEVQYPNQVLLRLSGDNVKLIDGVSVGDTVDLGFNSRVRSYQTRDGKTMHSQENNCWKIFKKWRVKNEEWRMAAQLLQFNYKLWRRLLLVWNMSWGL